MGSDGRMAILVGGGPAPGINAVIAAAAIAADMASVEALGIRDGFQWLLEGDTTRAERLERDRVERIHHRGGSVLGTSRANPTKSADGTARVLAALDGLGVDKLVTIGGDDTAFSALSVARAASDLGRRLAVVHVPKTIDNDLDLPWGIDTFGFQTARHLGARLVRNMLTDAETTSRWYFLVAMGRKAGHLAVGMGAAAGATLTLIAEDYPEGPIPLAAVADALTGAVLKRRTQGRPHGVAIVAEGIVERLDRVDLAELESIERDEHGHIRIAEVDLGRMLKRQVRADLAELGCEVTIVSKNIGYELRCADPIASDLVYCRELGYAAAAHVISGGTDCLMSIQGGRPVPIQLEDLIDPATGRTRVRLHDVGAPSYAVAKRYMTRLTADDLAVPDRLARLAGEATLSPEEFRRRFDHVARE